MNGLHGFASGRKFVDDADAEVTIDGHGECSWNGCSRHDEDVGWSLVLVPQSGALCYSETMLFVDDAETEVGKLHFVFEQRVGADEDVYLSRAELLVECFALFACGRAGEQGYADIGSGEQLADGLHVLLREDLGGSHDAGLKAVVGSQESTEQGNERFAGADIAL